MYSFPSFRPPLATNYLFIHPSMWVSCERKRIQVLNPIPRCVCGCVSKGGIKSIELQWTTIAHWNLLTFTFCPSRAEDYYAREIHYSQECHRQFDKSFQATTITSRNTTAPAAEATVAKGGIILLFGEMKRVFTAFGVMMMRWWWRWWL